MGVGTSPPASTRRSKMERLSHWLSDEALTWLLFFLIANLFIVPALGGDVGRRVVNIAFTALLFTGLATVANRGFALLAVGVLVLSAVVLRWVAPVSDLPDTPALAVGAAVVVFVVFTFLVLLRTLSPGPIRRQRIEGAIAVYLLIAMTFALAFQLIELVQPGSLDLSAGGRETLEQSVGYFSVVTLTTVGYGDVTPVSPLARRLAGLEGLIGQLYPAIIIGWMVGSMKRRED